MKHLNEGKYKFQAKKNPYDHLMNKVYARKKKQYIQHTVAKAKDERFMADTTVSQKGQGALSGRSSRMSGRGHAGDISPRCDGSELRTRNGEKKEMERKQSSKKREMFEEEEDDVYVVVDESVCSTRPTTALSSSTVPNTHQSNGGTKRQSMSTHKEMNTSRGTKSQERRGEKGRKGVMEYRHHYIIVVDPDMKYCQTLADKLRGVGYMHVVCCSSSTFMVVLRRYSSKQVIVIADGRNQRSFKDKRNTGRKSKRVTLTAAASAGDVGSASDVLFLVKNALDVQHVPVVVLSHEADDNIGVQSNDEAAIRMWLLQGADAVLHQSMVDPLYLEYIITRLSHLLNHRPVSRPPSASLHVVEKEPELETPAMKRIEGVMANQLLHERLQILWDKLNMNPRQRLAMVEHYR